MQRKKTKYKTINQTPLNPKPRNLAGFFFCRIHRTHARERTPIPNRAAPGGGGYGGKLGRRKGGVSTPYILQRNFSFKRILRASKPFFHLPYTYYTTHEIKALERT